MLPVCTLVQRLVFSVVVMLSVLLLVMLVVGKFCDTQPTLLLVAQKQTCYLSSSQRSPSMQVGSTSSELAYPCWMSRLYSFPLQVRRKTTGVLEGHRLHVSLSLFLPCFLHILSHPVLFLLSFLDYKHGICIQNVTSGEVSPCTACVYIVQAVCQQSFTLHVLVFTSDL